MRKALFVCLYAALLALIATSANGAEQSRPPIRFGITPAIVHDQYGVLDDWRVYLERKLQRKVEFVSRDSYRDTIDLLKQKKIDFAWVSTYPYVYLAQQRYARLLGKVDIGVGRHPGKIDFFLLQQINGVAIAVA